MVSIFKPIGYWPSEIRSCVCPCNLVRSSKSMIDWIGDLLLLHSIVIFAWIMSHYSSPTPLNVDIRVDAKNGKNKCTLKPPLHNCQPNHNKITKAEKFAAYIRIFIETDFSTAVIRFHGLWKLVRNFCEKQLTSEASLFYPQLVPWESLRVLIGNFFQCSFWSLKLPLRCDFGGKSV